ncbi:hypothetical protein GDO78_019777 [Eleutherodactylus coqui]|uniref:Uncharacterized protein n=1 Tax=Eleutherodactylus coqui TaxID=57060 RepID=A0A8J6B3D6_ELECQ|nr:hypothetical protein GDO78_019777 [Eleutherodactylus coqui]
MNVREKNSKCICPSPPHVRQIGINTYSENAAYFADYRGRRPVNEPFIRLRTAVYYTRILYVNIKRPQTTAARVPSDFSGRLRHLPHSRP